MHAVGGSHYFVERPTIPVKHIRLPATLKENLLTFLTSGAAAHKTTEFK